MGTIQFVLSIIAVFLGVLGGFLLSWIAPEELLPGRKYFMFAKKLLLSVILILFVYSLQLLLGYEILLVALVILLVIIAPLKARIFYPLTALVLVLSLSQPNLFLVQAVLVFVYGMIISTIYCSSFIKKESFTETPGRILIKLILRYISFLIVGIAAYLILLLI